jgi:hypothetical protein
LSLQRDPEPPFLSTMALVVSQVSAAQAVGEYLQSPDDLIKVAAFRKKLEKEKASIDARLKSGVKEQLDATREGLKKLLSTRNHVQVLKEEMQTIDRLNADPQNVVSTFDQISRVSWSRTRGRVFNPNVSLLRVPWFTGTLSRRRK